MSRVGKAPIPVPAGVSNDAGGTTARVAGPKGELTVPIPHGIRVAVEAATAQVTRSNDSRPQRSLHGLTRALLANAVQGVSAGFQKQLELVGVGFRAQVQGKTLTMQLGYSHPVEFPIPEGIAIAVEANTKIVVEGTDRQQVGQVAANIRRCRPPEPYKGKGVRYAGEVVRRKVGKTGATGAA